MLPRLQRVAPEAAIVTRPRAHVPPLVDEPDGAAETLVKFLTGANQTIGIAFATEAGQFQAAGLSAIVCGPGSILQAHQPDEFIELSQIAGRRSVPAQADRLGAERVRTSSPRLFRHGRAGTTIHESACTIATGFKERDVAGD